MSSSRSADDRKPAAVAAAATNVNGSGVSGIPPVRGSTRTSSSSSNTKGQQQSQSQQQAPPQQTYYAFDENKLHQLRSESPWTNSPKYFTKVAISPSAIITMMTHCQSGVDKGRSQRSTRTGSMSTATATSTAASSTATGNPIEVMGLLLGRPDPIATTTLVVTDAFPLPIEGFETRVVADDESVVNHMIALGEVLEQSRKERFMGWYHSHPFDLKEDGSSHCFLSQTDLSTQLQWQRAEDGHGNPFCAIVVDPILSCHVGTPQLKAFRAYPPEYASPTRNECPDGSIQNNEQVRLEVWGSCWNRYYELPIEYFMSSSARHVLEQLTRDYLWMRTLTTSAHTNSSNTGGGGGGGGNNGQNQSHQVGAAGRTPELMNIAQTVERVTTEVNLVRQVRSEVGGGGAMASSSTIPGGHGTRGGGLAALAASQTGGSSGAAAAAGGGSGNQSKNAIDDLHQATRQLANVASDQLEDLTLQWTKQQVFGNGSNKALA